MLVRYTVRRHSSVTTHGPINTVNNGNVRGTGGLPTVLQASGLTNGFFLLLPLFKLGLLNDEVIKPLIEQIQFVGNPPCSTVHVMQHLVDDRRLDGRLLVILLLFIV